MLTVAPYKKEEALQVLSALRSSAYVGRSLALGFTVLMHREAEEFRTFLREGQVEMAALFAQLVAKSPNVWKFINRPAPELGWRELDPLFAAATSNPKAIRAIARLRQEGYVSEIKFLLSLRDPPLQLEGAELLGRSIATDRRLGISISLPPFPQKAQSLPGEMRTPA